MNDQHDKFKNISAGIQSIVVSIAVVVGGLWTAWEFYHLDRIAQAEADLDLKIASLDTYPVINLQLAASTISYQQNMFIKLIVTIKNEGSRGAYFDFSEQTISLYKANLSKYNNIIFDAPYFSGLTAPHEKLPGIPSYTSNAYILSGQQHKYEILLPVKEKGIYLAGFKTKVSENSARLPKENDQFKGQWSQYMFHVVN